MYLWAKMWYQKSSPRKEYVVGVIYRYAHGDTCNGSLNLFLYQQYAQVFVIDGAIFHV